MCTYHSIFTCSSKYWAYDSILIMKLTVQAYVQPRYRSIQNSMRWRRVSVMCNWAAIFFGWVPMWPVARCFPGILNTRQSTQRTILTGGSQFVFSSFWHASCISRLMCCDGSLHAWLCNRTTSISTYDRIYVYIFIYIWATYIHTYIRMYIHTVTHAYIHTYAYLYM